MGKGICSVEGCGKPVHGQGLCGAHYRRWRISQNGPCSIDGCEELAYARGWCNRHYSRWLRHGDPTMSLYDLVTYCAFAGCERESLAQGLCGKHYQRLMHHGDPSVVLPGGVVPTDPGIRFAAFVGPPGPIPINRPELGPCRWWTGAIGRQGYGKFKVAHSGPQTSAHVFAWQAAGLNIPAGYQLDHLCHSVDLEYCQGGASCMHRRCVEVAHLEAVPVRVNVLRSHGPAAVNARKTHCIRGHPLSGDNLYVSSDGCRHCRACNRRRSHG
jgi:hypothetical protein